MMPVWPRELGQLIERGRHALDRAIALAPRAIALLDQAETLMTRADRLVTDIDDTNQRAQAVVDHVAATAAQAQAAVAKVTSLIDQLTPLMTAAEPATARLLPILNRFADSVTPQDVTATVQLINELPGIAGKLDHDILPVLDTLGTVAPDVRDLLDGFKDLSELLGAVPGLGRVKRRITEDPTVSREYRAAEEPPPAPDRAPAS